MNGEFEAGDGLMLKYTNREAEIPKGIVVIVHGVSEHMQRYADTIRFLSKSGFSCRIFDQRGFGTSAGPRGHVESFHEYVADLAVFVDAIADDDQGKPLFVLAHSMGSLVALLYAAQRPPKLSGLISLSTPLESNSIVKWVLPLTARLAGPLPNLSLPNFLNVDHLSHDEEVTRAYAHDALIVRTVTTSWLGALAAARKRVLDQANRITVPVFIGHGSDDQIASVGGAGMLAEELQAAATTLKVYEGLRHELLNESEPGRSRVRQDILTWLDEKTSQYMSHTVTETTDLLNGEGR